jgi:hypothetical protein
VWWIFWLGIVAYLYVWGPLWPWSYGSWTYNYMCNQCLSSLMLWVRILIRARYTTLCDKGCHWLPTGRWFSLDPPDSSTNKTYRHDITEILLKVALNTIKQRNIFMYKCKFFFFFCLIQNWTVFLSPVLFTVLKRYLIFN